MALIACPECRAEVSDVAAACPQCGYPITPAEEPPPESKPRRQFRSGCLLVLLLTAVVGAVLSAIVRNDTPPPTAATAADSARPRDDTISKVAQVAFMKSRMEDILRLTDSACKDAHRRARARSLAGAHADWTGEDIADVACGKITMGMTGPQVRAAWGAPDHINRTVVGDRVSEQWVYGSSYIYLADDHVTSWQDTR